MSARQKELFEVQIQIKDLEDRIYGLECADNFLFSNRNGNKSLYDSMQEELKDLRKQEREIIDGAFRIVKGS